MIPIATKAERAAAKKRSDAARKAAATRKRQAEEEAAAARAQSDGANASSNDDTNAQSNASSDEESQAERDAAGEARAERVRTPQKDPVDPYQPNREPLKNAGLDQEAAEAERQAELAEERRVHNERTGDPSLPTGFKY